MPNGEHNEAFWRDQFTAAYLWMFSSFASNINETIIKEIQLVPNPSKDEISIEGYIFSKNDSLQIIDMKGMRVMQMSMENVKKIDIKELLPGSYIVIIKSNKNTYQGKFIKQ